MQSPEIRGTAWTGTNLVGDLSGAIAYFHEQLPGWWFSVGICHVSADATVCPDRMGCDGWLLRDGGRETIKFWDEGFDVDLPPPATISDSLIRATNIARKTRDAYCVRKNLGDAHQALIDLGIAP